MCRMCNDRSYSRDDWLSDLRAQIQRDGWAVQPVSGTGGRAAFAYTAGLTAQGLPELVVTGLRADLGGQLLDNVARYLVHTSTVLPGETMETGPFLLEFLRVDRPAEHLYGAVELFGPGVRAMQLAWVDDRGRWPWEPGHRAGRGGQPLLGRREPSWCDEHRPPA